MELILMHIPSFDDIQDARRILSNLSVNHWKHDDLFSPSWWFLLAATIFPYIIWWRVVDKSRYFEIFSFGLISACFSVVLDVIGVDLLWWGYPDKLFSMIPPLFPADLVVIPVTLMIIYQLNKNWTPFVVAIIIWAAVLSYLLEPAFIHFHLLAFEKWSHTKSFFGFIVFGIFNKFIINTMIKGLNNDKNKQRSER